VVLQQLNNTFWYAAFNICVNAHVAKWCEWELLIALLCVSVQPTDSRVQQDSGTATAAGAFPSSSGAGSSRAAAAAARRGSHNRTSSLELGRGGPGQLAAAGSSPGDPGGLSMATLVLQVCVRLFNCVFTCMAGPWHSVQVFY
jgi:hypothetical protein